MGLTVGRSEVKRGERRTELPPSQCCVHVTDRDLFDGCDCHRLLRCPSDLRCDARLSLVQVLGVAVLQVVVSRREQVKRKFLSTTGEDERRRRFDGETG